VAAQSEVWFYGRLLAGIAGSNPGWTWMYISLECFVLSGTGLSDGLISCPEESSDCGASECDREALVMRRPWRVRDFCTPPRRE
jgi:hypothetical protein